MESEVRYLRLRTGITVPCFIHGEAGSMPLLLLHAWGESRRSFDRLVPLLTGYTVYAPDLRGHGDADKPEDGYSLAEQADDAAAILEALDARRHSSLAPPAEATWHSNWQSCIPSGSRLSPWWAHR